MRGREEEREEGREGGTEGEREEEREKGREGGLAPERAEEKPFIRTSDEDSGLQQSPPLLLTFRSRKVRQDVKSSEIRILWTDENRVGGPLTPECTTEMRALRIGSKTLTDGLQMDEMIYN